MFIDLDLREKEIINSAVEELFDMGHPAEEDTFDWFIKLIHFNEVIFKYGFFDEDLEEMEASLDPKLVEVFNGDKYKKK